SLDDEERHRVHGLPVGLVYQELGWKRSRVFPNWRGHRGGLPALRGADALPRFRNGKHSLLELFLPNLGFNHFLWIIFGRRPQRKDHVGETGYRYAEVYRRIGCDDCGSANFCVDIETIISDHTD